MLRDAKLAREKIGANALCVFADAKLARGGEEEEVPPLGPEKRGSKAKASGAEEEGVGGKVMTGP
jgi:hypothetical protein